MDNDNKPNSRREFVKKSTALGAGAILASGVTPSLFAGQASLDDPPAILGGTPVRSDGWPSWPRWKPEEDEERLLEAIRSGVWSRAELVSEFEEKWADTVGANRCLTVVNGTNALICALANLGIGGGHEVLVPPYTFIAQIQAVLQNGAMPVFVDTDPETFQMDVDKIEENITPRTKAIFPVHILGLPADMPRIMEIAERHDLLVVEDACQAWLAEINNQQVGTFGDAGCFSFQNSKHLPMGEGGAIVSNDEEFIDRCYSYHNFGSRYGSVQDDSGDAFIRPGTKLRLTEYQAAIGLAQLKRLEEETQLRNENAEYLKSQLEGIPGIVPYRLYDDVTRAAYHLFPFRYQQEGFEGLSRGDFLSALREEGVPCSSGYRPLNDQQYLKQTFESHNFQKMYDPEDLDFDAYVARNQCPENDRLCNEEAAWFSQRLLLGSRADMDDVAVAIQKIQRHAGEIKNRA